MHSYIPSTDPDSIKIRKRDISNSKIRINIKLVIGISRLIGITQFNLVTVKTFFFLGFFFSLCVTFLCHSPLESRGLWKMDILIERGVRFLDEEKIAFDSLSR